MTRIGSHIAIVAIGLAAFVSPRAWSVACDAIFTNAVQSHDSGGSVSLNYQSEISGGGSVIDTVSLSTGGQVTCGGSNCTASGSPAESSTPTFQTGSGSDGDVNAAGPQGNNTNVPEGDYQDINVVQGRSLTFTTTDGLYLMESLTTNFQSDIRFRSGDYWVDGDMTIGQETDFELLGGGTVRIFVDGDINFNFQAQTSGFAPEQLLIYATGNITLDNEVQVAGFMYAQQQFQARFQAEIDGAVSATTVNFANEVQADYAGGVLSSADFFPFCGSSDPPAVLESQWHFDEFVWQGSAGEVEDSSGNGRDGTASGDANTDDASPAIAGNPGTCRYGVLDGDGDYVTVPGLSDVLNDTASLAFWINTTQTGNNTNWQAPGVAGVEVSGGTDDIFWGWIDAGGSIGIAVGDNATARSTTAINDGAWHHVALTRNQQTGDYKIYVDGALEDSGTLATGVIGNSYSRLGRIEDTGGSPEDLAGQLDEVHLYSGVLTDSEVSGLMSDTHPCPQQVCPSDSEVGRGGLIGDYYDELEFNGGVVGTRVDGPINFDWDSGSPGVSGVSDDQFSIRWNGFIRAPETGNYRFQTASDDGVRLYVDGQLLIERWNDHGVITDTSAPVSLEAGQVYPIRLEFYENGGLAEIRLRWQTPSSGSYVPIPAGTDAPDLDDGLYYCEAQQAAYYGISHSLTGVTCEAEPVTITAYDSSGDEYEPPAGTVLDLATTPASGEWVGGNSYTFSGGESSFSRPLRQVTPATLSIDVYDGNASEDPYLDPDLTFSDVGLKFYGDTSLAPMPSQYAGVEDGQPVLRIVETNSDTGACDARVVNDSETVSLGFECVNPGTCVAGQTFEIDSQAIATNDNGSSANQTDLTLSFDGNGFASIPLSYTDVGQVRLHGSVQLPEEGDDPAITVTGSSSPFVVKPYTLTVAAVNRSDGTANPATTGSGNGFVAAGEAFEVVIEGRNAQGNATPNYGNETTPQSPLLDDASLSVVYPTGGVAGVLSGANESAFTAVSGNNGQFRSDSVSWDEVGTFTIIPRLYQDDYLSAGDLSDTTRTGNIGRFYPQEYVLTSATVTDSCSSAAAFTYMDEPAIDVDYTLQAHNLAGNTLQNYDEALGYAGAQETYDYENAGECLPAPGSCDGGARLELSQAPVWQNGQLNVEQTATFMRDAAPQAPLDQLQLAFYLTGDLDNRPIQGLDANPQTSGDCSTAGNCTMKSLGGLLDLRYGRLKLGSAYGPEILDLPVDMGTQYYDGSRWVTNEDDSCTRINRTAITYPDGTIDVDSNRDVTVGGGTARGEYPGSIDATAVYTSSGEVDHYFSAPGSGNGGVFDVTIDHPHPWLTHDWDRDGTIESSVTGTYQFGSYRGHDRIIYWREVLD